MGVNHRGHSGHGGNQNVTPRLQPCAAILARLSLRTLRFAFSHFASYTVLPPTTVRRTLVPRTFAGGTDVISRSRTTKSASIPGASVPFSFSANSAKAEPVV